MPKTKTCGHCKRRKPINSYYRTGRAKQPMSYCKACFIAYDAERSRRLKKRAVEYLGGRCVDCTKKHHYAVFEFHHRDPAQKEIAFGAIRRRAWSKVLTELDKCDLLCANCHRLRHWGHLK